MQSGCRVDGRCRCRRNCLATMGCAVWPAAAATMRAIGVLPQATPRCRLATPRWPHGAKPRPWAKTTCLSWAVTKSCCRTSFPTRPFPGRVGKLVLRRTGRVGKPSDSCRSCILPCAFLPEHVGRIGALCRRLGAVGRRRAVPQLDLAVALVAALRSAGRRRRAADPAGGVVRLRRCRLVGRHCPVVSRLFGDARPGVAAAGLRRGLLRLPERALPAGPGRGRDRRRWPIISSQNALDDRPDALRWDLLELDGVDAEDRDDGRPGPTARPARAARSIAGRD